MSKPKTPNQKSKYNELSKRIAKYILSIKSIYETLNLEAAKIVESTGVAFDAKKPFSFNDFPETKKKVESLLSSYRSEISTLIYSCITEEWKNSNIVQDLLANSVLKAYDATIDGERKEILYQTNSDALKSFLSRRDRGLNLSDKIWVQSLEYKNALEETISCAIEKGTSAITLSKRVSQYMGNYPSMRKDYTRLYGKASTSYDCEYRSMRLAASEINMAYRSAENLRWQQMDFVVGYEIKLSGNHNCKGVPKGQFRDICDDLKGKYPKDFVWTGWHPLCRCYKIPILKTEEEFWSWDGKGEAPTDSINKVNDVPDEFKKWLKDNEERYNKARKRGTLPYFMRENDKYVKENTKKAKNVENSLYTRIKETEKQIRQNKDFETGVVFDKNGNILVDKRGSARHVAFTKDECAKMKDAIITHNHPGGWEFAENRLGRVGNSFSADDIVMAIAYDLEEIRAVTPLYTFSMKRPKDGWRINWKEARKAYASMKNSVDKYMNVYFDKVGREVENYARANAICYHLVNRKLAKKYGWEYTKIKG